MFCTSLFPHDKATDNAAPSQNKLRPQTSMWHLIKVAMLTKSITECLFSLGLAASQAAWHPSHCWYPKDIVRDITFCFSSRKSFWVAPQNYCGFAVHILPIPPTYPRMDFLTLPLHSASVTPVLLTDSGCWQSHWSRMGSCRWQSYVSRRFFSKYHWIVCFPLFLRYLLEYLLWFLSDTEELWIRRLDVKHCLTSEAIYHSKDCSGSWLKQSTSCELQTE